MYFYDLERLVSFECWKVIGFTITTPRDWLKKLAPLFNSIRSKTKTNRNSLARVFPRFTSATCNYLELWLVCCIVCVFCNWLEWLLWFWFYNTQLKTAQMCKSLLAPHCLGINLLFSCTCSPTMTSRQLHSMALIYCKWPLQSYISHCASKHM